MKKIVFTILFLAVFGLSGMAQSGIYSGGVSEIVKHDLRKTRWIVRPELGFVVGEGEWDSGILFCGANAGYQISPHFYLGGGTGFYTKFRNGYHYESGTFGLYYAIPLYTSFRWYWFDGVSSPFLELNAGLLSMFSYDRASFFMFYPALGWDIKNFGIKIGVSYPQDNVCVGLVVDYSFLLKQKTKE